MCVCVQVIKHVYTGHVVLQLDCTNTLNDQLLENVSVEMEAPEGWQLVRRISTMLCGLNSFAVNYCISVRFVQNRINR